MAITMLSWLLAIPLLGFCTGLRCMTPIAVGCLFVYFHHLPVAHSWAYWITYPATIIVFSLLALGEYIGDKLPNTPNRTAPFPLIARLVFGGLVGALAATGLKGSILEGIILGVIGAVLGTFIGFHVRRYLVERTGWPDWTIAVVEDAFAILVSVYACGIITG